MEIILKYVANIDSSYSWLPTYRNSKPNLGLYTCRSIAYLICTHTHRPKLMLIYKYADLKSNLGWHTHSQSPTALHTHTLKIEPQLTNAQIQCASLVHTRTNTYPVVQFAFYMHVGSGNISLCLVQIWKPHLCGLQFSGSCKVAAVTWASLTWYNMVGII
jgi:hypothetical protein